MDKFIHGSKIFETAGIEGLYDQRGRRKPKEELTELEKLQAENRMLKAQAKQQQVEIDFLKKLDAVERRRVTDQYGIDGWTASDDL